MILSELRQRGLFQQSTEEIDEHLEIPRTVYCGFDATGPSLHVGHLIPALGLRRFLEHGHRAVALLGGGTALIGDPSGRSKERKLLDHETVASYAVSIGKQLGDVIDPGNVFRDSGQLQICNNADWLLPTPAVDFLRDVGKHFTIGSMLQKDSVRSRLDGGLSFTEFSYMLLQAWDFLELQNRHSVTVQIGGSDQWGNMTAGTELIRKATGKRAHVLTFPLMTTASGVKFGKSENGSVWLDRDRTTPQQFYEFWLRSDDRDVVTLLQRFTFLSDDDIAGQLDSLRANPHLREAHHKLAESITSLVHGEEDAQAARKWSEHKAKLLRGAEGDWHRQIAGIEAEMVEYRLSDAPARPREDLVDIVDVAARIGLTKTKSDARRLLEQNGLYLDGKKLSAEHRFVQVDDWERTIILAKGNKSVLRVRFLR